jgi:N-acetylglucosaminyldiphosphoundecaprenol N-acetyl-beta-D-mannosaminyltransferase
MGTAGGRRVRIGGVPIDSLTLAGAVDAVGDLVLAGKGGAVFTPNVDHVVEYAENPALREAYEAASLSLPDGMPVLWAAKLLGTPLREKVSGSDFVMPLLERCAARGWRVFLLGGGEGVAARAKAELARLVPALVVVGSLGPRVDMREPAARRADIVAAIKAASPDVVVVGLGAPKQELFIHESRGALAPAVLLGLGACIDFVAGTIPRAPRWMSKSGLEWAYRLAREPRRLWRRYLVRDPKFVRIVLESARGK